MRIALTGVSSFTGFHIASALRSAGHEVLGILTRSPEAYAVPLLQARLGLSNIKQEMLFYEAPFGSANFLSAIKNFTPQVFINHGAEIKGYRSPDFDAVAASMVSLLNADKVIQVLAKADCARVVHSGTVFEPIDGIAALSPYGQSKFMVSERLYELCESVGLSFSKVYIPNPIGSFENEDRLIPIFVKQWRAGAVPHLSTPKIVWDHLPAPWLAKVYLDESELDEGTKKLSIRRPSAFKIELGQFVERFVQHSQNLGLKRELSFTVGESLAAPVPRLNTEPCAELCSDVAVNQFYSDWIHSLFDVGDFK